jgi:hypothetical protein
MFHIPSDRPLGVTLAVALAKAGKCYKKSFKRRINVLTFPPKFTNLGALKKSTGRISVLNFRENRDAEEYQRTYYYDKREVRIQFGYFSGARAGW